MILTALLLLLSPQSAPVVLARSPHPGDASTTRLDIHHELLLETLSRQNGDAAPVVYQSAGTISSETFLEWRDDWTQLPEETRPGLRRHYRRVRLNAKAAYSPQGQPPSSDLTRFGSHFEDRTLRFQWIDEEGEYARHYEYYDGPEEPLARVREEADAHSLLPEEPVQPGDEWSFDGPALYRALTPGGNLDLMVKRASGTAKAIKLGVAGALADALSEESFGGGKGRLREVSQNEAGERIAQVDLSDLKLLSVADRTDSYEDAADERDEKEPALLSGVSIDVGLEGQGTLSWNLDRGRLESLKLDFDQRVTLSVTKQFFSRDDSFPVIEEATYRGTLKFEQKVETPE